MTLLNVPDMHCAHCAERIEKALAAAHIAASVSLENKTVSIEDDARLTEALGALDDLGFTAQKA